MSSILGTLVSLLGCVTQGSSPLGVAPKACFIELSIELDIDQKAASGLHRKYGVLGRLVHITGSLLKQPESVLESRLRDTVCDDSQLG